MTARSYATAEDLFAAINGDSLGDPIPEPFWAPEWQWVEYMERRGFWTKAQADERRSEMMADGEPIEECPERPRNRPHPGAESYYERKSQ